MRAKQSWFLEDSVSHSRTKATLGVVVWLLLTVLPVREAGGQGTVIFNNRITGGPGVGITLHVWGPSYPVPTSLIGLGSNDTPSGATPFGAANGMELIGAGGSGGHYGYATTFAQLLGAVGSNQPVSALVPVGQTTTFRSGTSLGDLAAITVTLTNNPGGGIVIPADAPVATFQMVAWDNSSGLYPTWAQASVSWMNSQIRAGKSAPFVVTAIGGTANSCPFLNNNQGSANGMTSFNLYGDCMNPIVVTLPATAVTATSAKLNATVYPGMGNGTVWLEWGATASYGNTAATMDIGCFCPNPPPLGPPVPLSAQLTGLTVNRTYHFRIGAYGHGGQFYGDDQTFTTLMPLPLIIGTGSGSWRAGSTTLSYTGGSAQSFILLQSADPIAPLSAWTRVATNSSTPGSFPIPPVGTAAPKYYCVRSE